MIARGTALSKRVVWPLALTLLLAFGCVVLAHPAHAEEAVAQVERPPHYVSDPVLIRITAHGFEEDPQPTCEVDEDVEGIDLHLVSASPNVSTMVQVFNGRRTEERTVRWVFDFHAVAAKEGSYAIGPFRVTQGGRTALSGKVHVAPRTVPLDPDSRIALRFSETPVYPGQRVAVEIEWAYAGDLKAIDDLTIRSPLFDRFAFEDEPFTRGDTVLPLVTDEGVVRVKASVEERTIDRKEWIVLTARRVLVPDRSGTYDLAPITLGMNKVVRWRRTFFGDREPLEMSRVRAEGRPRTLVVKNLPAEGRPESFAGAIGRGFTLEVAADRTVVRVGDPITLTLSLRGDGNLQNAGLPPLSADGGLDPRDFRLPDGEVAGVLEDGAKTFTVTVRVQSEAVDAIPAIAYSYFDPETEMYRTTRSDPIALQVGEAKVISARDVVSTPSEAGDRPESPAPSSAPGYAERPRFEVTGADLSIRTDPDAVLTNESSRLGGSLSRVVLYVAGVALLLLAWAGRRRAHVDPEQVRRRALLATQRKRLAEADTLGAVEGPRAAAGALRALVPDASPALKAELERASADLDAAAYAPGASSAGTIAPALLERARGLVERAAEELS